MRRHARIIKCDPENWWVQVEFVNGVVGDYKLEELRDAQGNIIKKGDKS